MLSNKPTWIKTDDSKAMGDDPCLQPYNTPQTSYWGTPHLPCRGTGSTFHDIRLLGDNLISNKTSMMTNMSSETYPSSETEVVRATSSKGQVDSLPSPGFSRGPIATPFEDCHSRIGTPVSAPKHSRHEQYLMYPMPNTVPNNSSAKHIRINRYQKPRNNLKLLIVEAIKDSPQQKLTLNEIYESIMKNYPYYKYCQGSWKNTVRNYLTLKKYFVKIPRPFWAPGRGNYWIVDPNHLSMKY